MEILLVGQGENEQVNETAKFLGNLCCNKRRKTLILSSREQEAIRTAKIIEDLSKLRRKEVGWLRFNKTSTNGSPNHKIKREIFIYSAKHSDINTFIILGNGAEIKLTLDVFAEMFMLDTKVFNTTVEKASVHRVDTIKREIEKIFTPYQK